MVIAILVLIGLGALFGLFYYLNSKTPVPEGCEDLTAECEGCKITSCAHNPVLKQSNGENKE